MDFFEHQERARRRTGLLLGYFLLAVLLTVAAVNLVFFVASAWLTQPGLTPSRWLAQPWWIAVTLGTLGVIGTGSLVRYLQLRQGGHVLAEMLGARRLDPDSKDARERVLLNVVEEMAIAAGTPAPETWVMDNEQAINAFVAGFQPTEAVLVVTQGALAQLDRDELQAVVGHEYSHILHGDMRLNVQLYAILAGILLIGRIGEFLVRSSGRRRSGSSRDGKGGGAPVLIGLALMAIGWIGLFFGRLIKAGISRQREFLADAASVQFTRNPAGLAEALLKIRNDAHGGLLDNAAAEDMSHMCFALPVRMRLAGLLATHPPLDARISAIDPGYLARDRARQRQQAQAVAAGSAPSTLPGVAGFAGGSSAVMAGSAPVTAVIASVGMPTPAHQAVAARLHAELPDTVQDLAHTPAGARLLAYGLVIAAMPVQYEAACIESVRRGDSNSLSQRLQAQLPDLRRLPTRLRLPCLDILVPALRTLSTPQRQAFLGVLDSLVHVDNRYTLSEYVLLALLQRQLAGDAGVLRPVRHRSFAGVAQPLNLLFSLLAQVGARDEDSRRDLHARVLATFGTGLQARIPAAELTASGLQAALAELAVLSPLLKKPVLDACLDCVQHDGQVRVAELELVRAVAAALDCPIPPLAVTA